MGEERNELLLLTFPKLFTELSSIERFLLGLLLYLTALERSGMGFEGLLSFWGLLFVSLWFLMVIGVFGC